MKLKSDKRIYLQIEPANLYEYSQAGAYPEIFKGGANPFVSNLIS